MYNTVNMRERLLSKVSGFFWVFAICFMLSEVVAASTGEMPLGSHSVFNPNSGRATGLSLMGLTPKLRVFFGAPVDKGLLVADVQPQSEASRAGLQVGDVILSCAGQPFERITDVLSILWKLPDTPNAKLKLIRNKKELELSADALMGSRPSFHRQWPFWDFYSWEEHFKSRGPNQKPAQPKSRRHKNREKKERQLERMGPSVEEWREFLNRFKELEDRLRELEGEAL